ncbi:VOC family protein [Mycobacterium asiaticum]|uniref:Glyoxalase n=1 Tax=Mycobacterium asiaticum TaxID=1790 RepID=A0A1A3KQL5_MYCAS|nr:VOC family protein [Mycobacterium asiaticum]OBJ86668.1 glyoxalase [Mycobacterium asiaticum]
MSRMFGSINQIGYVVRDIDAAMDRWVRHGVGPWFYIGDITVDYFRYRGIDSNLKMSVALANSGDLQLELIQQRNEAPSMYKDFLDSGRDGAQHIAYWSNDYQGLYDRAIAAGYTVAQEGCIGGERGRFAYLDTEFEQGTVIEISDISGPKGQLFGYIREVARNWDGTEPVRVLG